MSLLEIAVFVGGATSSADYTGAVMLGGVALLFTGLISGLVGSQVAMPQKIDKRFVWLRKVNPDFLAELSPWSS